jgi:hypothetical protein
MAAAKGIGLVVATHLGAGDTMLCNGFWPWYLEPECGDVWLRLERRGITMKILAKLCKAG